MIAAPTIEASGSLSNLISENTPTSSGQKVEMMMTQVSQTPSQIATTNNGSKLSNRSVNAIPNDKVRLDVLLITGQRKNFDFDPQTSIKEVRELLWQDWPQEWPPRPISSNAIRILHLGHILEDKFILAPIEVTSGTSMMRAMPIGKSTVVHLLLSQAPSKGDGDDESLKKNIRNDPGCCSCVIA